MCTQAAVAPANIQIKDLRPDAANETCALRKWTTQFNERFFYAAKSFIKKETQQKGQNMYIVENE